MCGCLPAIQKHLDSEDKKEDNARIEIVEYFREVAR
jgi:hypothetical protein